MEAEAAAAAEGVDAAADGAGEADGRLSFLRAILYPALLLGPLMLVWGLLEAGADLPWAPYLAVVFGGLTGLAAGVAGRVRHAGADDAGGDVDDPPAGFHVLDGLDGGCQCSLACAVGHDPQFRRLDIRIGIAVDGLPHDLNGDAVVGEEPGDLGQHAGLVRDVESDVVAGDRGGDGKRGHLAGRGLGTAGTAQDDAAGGGDEVAHHGRGGRLAAGALAVEHQLAGVFGLDEDGVEGSVHRGQRVFARQQGRVHADGHAGIAVGVCFRACFCACGR